MELISGISIEAEATSTDAEVPRRLEVKDLRGTPNFPRRRTAYLFDEDIHKDWLPELHKRLSKLADLNDVPHVSKPLEIGAADGPILYVLTARHQQALTAMLGKDGLFHDDGNEKAWRILSRIVDAMAALHQAQLIHGGLNPASVWLDGETPWLVDAAWGHLQHWSRNVYLPKDAASFQPPESITAEPSYRGDVYALGMLGLRLLVGDAVTASPVERAQALRHGGTAARRRQVLLAMVAEKVEDRPADALEVKKRLSAAEPYFAGRQWLIGALTTLTLLMTTAATFFWLNRGAPSDSLRETTNELAAAQTELRTATTAASKFRADNERLKGEVELLDAKVKGQEAVIVKFADDDPRRQLAKAAEETAKLRSENAAKQELIQQMAAFVPVKDGGVDLEALARREWRRLANDSALTGPAMNDAIKSIPQTALRERLQGWFDAMENPPPTPGYVPATDHWWIRPRKAAVSKKDFRTGRRLDIKVNDGKVYSGARHQWEQAEMHEYSDEKAARDKQETWIGFPWMPGDRITVSLMYDPGMFSSWAPISTRTFDGPMALWRLANEGLKDSSGTDVEFEIFRIHAEGRPGPARD